MPRREKHDAAEILSAFARKDEISIHDAAAAIGLSASDDAQRRAVQRLLKRLIDEGTLEAKGAARARVYRRKSAFPQETGPAHLAPQAASSLIPFSAPSKTLLKHLARDVRQRRPVSYNPDFLEKYEPNKSFFLSAKDRAKLQELGAAETATRPAGTYARRILQRLLIDLSWNSSRLEGNTYTLLQTKKLLEDGTAPEGKKAEETQMLLNHKAAIQFIVEEADEIEITRLTICQIHALLSDNLLGDPEASGRIRMIPVAIGESTYIPLAGAVDLTKYLDLFVKKARRIRDPFEQSFFSLVHLSYLQAFEDVNKRTSRLVANIPLVKRNLKPLSFADVPAEDYLKSLLGIYEANNPSLLLDLYVWAYERSAQKYSAIQQSMGEMNVLKLKHRDEIRKIIRAAVTGKIGKKADQEISARIQALGLPKEEAGKLFLAIETELASLHEGNIVLYQIKPADFRAWRKSRG